MWMRFGPVNTHPDSFRTFSYLEIISCDHEFPTAWYLLPYVILDFTDRSGKYDCFFR